MNENTRASFMEGRMSEAMRVSFMSTSPSPVYPYTWLKYYDTKDFVNQVSNEQEIKYKLRRSKDKYNFLSLIMSRGAATIGGDIATNNRIRTFSAKSTI